MPHVFCGWRRLAGLPADWRPDQSDILVIEEENKQPQFEALGLALLLVGNPLKTIRRPDFIDFVIRNVRTVALYLMLPGSGGVMVRRRQLNTPPILEAAAKSRADMKTALEMALKQLQAFPTEVHVMENTGHDFGT